PLFESLVDNGVAAAGPEKDLRDVSTPVEEGKQVPAKRILRDHLPHHTGQPIESFAQVYWLDGHIDSHRRREHQHGASSTRTSLAIASALKSLPTRITRPDLRTTSIVDSD